MKKIPTIFERDWDGDRSRVLDIQVPECAWVFAGEGRATQKFDGTSCAVFDGRLYKRLAIPMREVDRYIADYSEDFIFIEMEKGQDGKPDKDIGWAPVGTGPEDRWHREAFEAREFHADGTYELVGPKVQGNPERYPAHVLIQHGAYGVDPFPLTFDGIALALAGTDIEGIVWHHPDGRMAKIKARDFGYKRPTS